MTLRTAWYPPEECRLVYDGDGNRVQETVAGVTTSYLVADQNLTGWIRLQEIRYF